MFSSCSKFKALDLVWWMCVQ